MLMLAHLLNSKTGVVGYRSIVSILVVQLSVAINSRIDAYYNRSDVAEHINPHMGLYTTPGNEFSVR